MKSSKIKNEHYSNLKLLLRVLTLGVAVWALIVSYQNKQDLKWVQFEQQNIKKEIKWVQSENDNIIEKLMFPSENNFKNDKP